MSKPLENIIKSYPPRGPIRQYRFEKVISFDCFRCGQLKTAKLMTIYNNDWSKRLCNGCYGRLLSIFEIQSGQTEIDDKCNQLSTLLLKLVDEVIVRRKLENISIKERKSQYLSASALRFYATAECVAETLTQQANLDWSPAVIGICKAFELELLVNVIDPLKSIASSLQIPEIELKDKDFGRVVSYCTGKSSVPPELGVIKHFLLTAANSKERIAQSIFLRECLLPFLSKRSKSGWLTDNNGLIKGLTKLCNDFRNRAAHTDELEKIDYENCKELVFGEEGIMWKMIVGTRPQ